MVGKTEKTRFHAICEHKKRYSHYGIDIRHHTILRFGKHICVQWHQQPVQKSSDNAAESVHRCVFCKTSYCSHLSVSDKYSGIIHLVGKL